MKLTRRKILLGGALLAGAGGIAGWLQRRVRRRSIPAASAAAIGQFGDLQETSEFDVCIIGSGPAGAILGNDLAARGLRTVILESGTTLERMGSDPRYAGLAELSVPADSGIPYQTVGSRLVAVGGTSNLWTGRCSRLHPLDFEPNAYSAGWPISYDDLAPYLARAEQTLRVRGGELSNFHAPRTGPLPLPADLDISGLKERMSRIGLTIDDSPTSTSPNIAGEPVRPLVRHLHFQCILTGLDGLADLDLKRRTPGHSHRFSVQGYFRKIADLAKVQRPLLRRGSPRPAAHRAGEDRLGDGGLSGRGPRLRRALLVDRRVQENPRAVR